jgi:hypothetical protein
MMALYEVNRDIKLHVFGSQPRGEVARDVHESEYDDLETHRESLLRGEFPRESRFKKYVVDGDYECDECLNGHLHGCDALDVADLYDAMWKSCRGCCPNGCFEHGFAFLATVQGSKALSMVTSGREAVINIYCANPSGQMGPICVPCGGFGFFDHGPDSSTSTCESCSGIGVDEEALIESFNDDLLSGGP